MKKSNSSKHLLSVSYDESLLKTRHLLLEFAGYQVTSAYGFVDALEFCRRGGFDLVIIGHSTPRHDKEALLREVRKSGDTPVLSIYRTSEGPLPGVDYAIDGLEGPNALLELVSKALGKDTERKA